jgi:hypothetical protein
MAKHFLPRLLPVIGKPANGQHDVLTKKERLKGHPSRVEGLGPQIASVRIQAIERYKKGRRGQLGRRVVPEPLGDDLGSSLTGATRSRSLLLTGRLLTGEYYAA